jgi:hypothetical protein
LIERRNTVSDSRIGIKVADGSFYPVMEDGKPSRKKLVLTTVNDSQTNVQIDLYRGRENIEDASYVGSLLIENIPPNMKGEPEIELIVGLDEEGNLTAEASEHTSGEKRSLSVKIGEGSDMTAYDIPEFDLSEESSAGFEPDFSFDELDTDVESDDFSTEFAEEPGAEPEEYSEEPVRKGRVRPLLITLLVLLSLAFAALLIYCLMNWLPVEKVPPLRAEQTTVQEAPAVAGSTAEPAGQVGPAEAPEPAEPAEPVGPAVEVENVRVEVEGVWYRIRRGDTLWDISSSFYNSPWLYGQIAEENNIRNPDIIFAEQKIFIPKK